MECCLTFPWPPSVNHYKKIGCLIKTKSGKMYQQRVNTSETKTFYYQAYIIGKQCMPIEWPKFASREDIRYQVNAYLYPPNNLRYDLDNRLKVLLDSLMHAHIIKDDSQIHRLSVEKMNIMKDGQVVIKIKEII